MIEGIFCTEAYIHIPFLTSRWHLHIELQVNQIKLMQESNWEVESVNVSPQDAKCYVDPVCGRSDRLDECELAQALTFT